MTENDTAHNDEPETTPSHHEEELVETRHEAEINGERFAYTATAGRILLRAEEGKKRASFFFVSYRRDDVADPAARPIVFAFNGGPGSSSVWLHLGLLGPQRVDMDSDAGPVPSPGRLITNDASILDIADLVFIDPVSTGFSRAIPEEEAKEFHSFKRDIESVGDFIRLFLTRFSRWASPKFLIGESYGTTRSAGLSGYLLDRHGIALNGVMLVSSVLNFQTIAIDHNGSGHHRGNDLPYLGYLPSYTAAAWYHGRLAPELQGLALDDLLAQVEAFVDTEYAPALFLGSRLEAATRDRLAGRIAAFTGLDPSLVAAVDLRIEMPHFCKELLRDVRRTVGRLDARYRGIDRYPASSRLEHDPSLDALTGPYTSALNDYVRRVLSYESDLPYEILTDRVMPWSYADFENAFVDVSETLRNTMSRNPAMRVFVASGYYDLATPYYATRFTFDHLGLEPELRDNVTMSYYEAGHFMYVHTPSLLRLRSDLSAFISGAVAAGG
jgi:carboxypeptidase C (cathepsin A)